MSKNSKYFIIRFCFITIPFIVAVVYFIWGGDPEAEGKFKAAFWILVIGLLLVLTAWKHVKTFDQLKPFLITGAVIVAFIVWGKYITIWKQVDLVVMSLSIAYMAWLGVTTTSYKSLLKDFSNPKGIAPLFMAIIFAMIPMFFVFFVLAAIGLADSSLYNYAEPWMCPPGVETLAVGLGFREFDMPGYVAMISPIPNCRGEAGAFTYSSIHIIVVTLLVAASFIFFMMILATVANLVRKIPYIGGSENRFKAVTAVLSIIIMGGSNVYASQIFSPIALQLHSVIYKLSLNASYNQLLVKQTDKGDIESIKILLKGGASASGYRHSKYYTSVVAAANHGYPEIMAILLAERDDVATARDVRTALLSVVKETNMPGVTDQKYVDTARVLLDAGANPLAEGANSWSLISLAQRDSRMVAVMMDAAVKKDPRLSALWEEGIALTDNEFIKAIEKNDITSVKLFIELGMNASSGRYLVYSASNGHPEMTRLLLKYCSDINYQYDKEATPLIAASLSNFDRHIETAKILLDAGADLNLKGRAGRYLTPGTAMFHARRNPEMLAVLMEALSKQSPDIAALWAEKVPYTREHFKKAIRSKNANLVQHFSNAGAIKFYKYDWLWLAALKGNVEIVNILIKAGADLNKGPGQTHPLHVAVGYPSRETQNYHIVKALLEGGADPNLKNVNFITPARVVAPSSDKNKIIVLLKEYEIRRRINPN